MGLMEDWIQLGTKQDSITNGSDGESTLIFFSLRYKHLAEKGQSLPLLIRLPLQFQSVSLKPIFSSCSFQYPYFYDSTISQSPNQKY